MYDQTRAQQPAGQNRTPTERRAPGPEPLLPSAEREKVLQRLRHALNTFADTPHDALEEAESAYDEATAQLVTALAARRDLLRAAWADQDTAVPTDPAEPADLTSQSDELRHALRQYREITQRLLQL
ncbi:hypothetical protein R6V09_07385 [Streptomyces sp. W16]|uniref:hypothetical protein n=1 Tax=Streptomyces sp. W16 TaxID=3076631 RepID=UPI00295BBE23|nr:hypothetical protein [Streptomyces sp. W16]MDV9169960.1 hypothetical protein [Streptomyces sp. W16]